MNPLRRAEQSVKERRWLPNADTAKFIVLAHAAHELVADATNRGGWANDEITVGTGLFHDVSNALDELTKETA